MCCKVSSFVPHNVFYSFDFICELVRNLSVFTLVILNAALSSCGVELRVCCKDKPVIVKPFLYS